MTFVSLAVLGTVLAGRLALGPLRVDWLTPYVTEALSSDEARLMVRARSTELFWDGRGHQLRVRVRDVLARSASGTVGFVPSLTVGLSLRALLRGVIAPAEVIVDRARLRLALRADGSIDLGLGTGEGSTVRSSPGALADRLGRGWLRSLVVRRGSVELVDATRRNAWQARAVDLMLRPAGSGLQAGMTGRVVSGSTVVPVRMKVVYRRDPEPFEVTVAFRGLDPSTAGVAIPLGPGVLRHFARLRLPLDGRIVLTLDDSFQAERVRLKLLGGQGTIAMAGVPGGTLAISRLRAALSLERSADAMRLQLVSLGMGRPMLRVRGEVHGLRGPGRVDLVLSLSDLPMDDLRR
ncbi:MAG TPA: hypothetical protein VII47_16355, partial [Actinomycetota bacterium]